MWTTPGGLSPSQLRLFHCLWRRYWPSEMDGSVVAARWLTRGDKQRRRGLAVDWVIGRGMRTRGSRTRWRDNRVLIVSQSALAISLKV